MTYNPRCRCGHKHSEHDPAGRDHNYSAGKCGGKVVTQDAWKASVWSKCTCEHFIITT